MADPEADTAPLEETFLRTVVVHNREFQLYSIQNLINMVPIDEDEAERLGIQHRMLSYVFDYRLIFPQVTNPQRILDCGYGTASWAIEVAEKYPNCDVIGVDISPHLKPEETPDNLWLQVDDLNKPFTFHSNTFDVIHSQLVAGGINRSRWPRYVRDMARVLKPGGWLQMVEAYYNCQSDNGSLNEGHAIRQWSELCMRALEDVKDPRAPTRLPTFMSHAGLVNIETRMLQLPTCGWPSNNRDRIIGERNKENVSRALSSVALYPLVERLGISPGEFQVLVAQARQEARDPSLKLYFPLYVCLGQKPYS